MDYIIKDGWIVNGKKEKPFHGDLVIENGKIAEVGTHVEIPADFPKERVLNAAGGYITPGFLDIHRHGDWQAFGNGDDELLNRQGLTTVVNGNCGLSVARPGEIWERDCQISQQCDWGFRWEKMKIQMIPKVTFLKKERGVLRNFRERNRDSCS